jgi:hypothetical protein
MEKTAMAYPGSYPASSGSWPVTSDTGTASVRADVAAFVLLVVGGAAGIAQLLVPWMSGSTEAPGRSTGWQLFQIIKRLVPDQGFSFTFAGYAILAVAVVGVAMVLLGVAMLFPIDHRPPGIVGLLASLIAVICAGWWVFWGPTGGISFAFQHAWIGWYLFIAAGVVGLVGAIKSLVTS